MNLLSLQGRSLKRLCVAVTCLALAVPPDVVFARDRGGSGGRGGGSSGSFSRGSSGSSSFSRGSSGSSSFSRGSSGASSYSRTGGSSWSSRSSSSSGRSWSAPQSRSSGASSGWSGSRSFQGSRPSGQTYGGSSAFSRPQVRSSSPSSSSGSWNRGFSQTPRTVSPSQSSGGSQWRSSPSTGQSPRIAAPSTGSNAFSRPQWGQSSPWGQRSGSTAGSSQSGTGVWSGNRTWSGTRSSADSALASPNRSWSGSRTSDPQWNGRSGNSSAGRNGTGTGNWSGSNSGANRNWSGSSQSGTTRWSGSGSRFASRSSGFNRYSQSRGYPWHRNYHNNWLNGYWQGGWGGNRFSNRNWGYSRGLSAWWFAGSLLFNSGYYSYFNPYCDFYGTGFGYGPGVVYDYTQPIVVVQQPNEEDATVAAALDRFEFAQAAFYEGDYDAALGQINASLQSTPNDAIFHQFRALVLFAMQRYQESAAALYAVLSVGPGWDWETMSSLYPAVDLYTQQLRALEAYAGLHPELAEARFVLAYHYMTTGYPDAAAAQLKRVVQLQPQDRVSAQLLEMLSENGASAQPGTALPMPDATQLPLPDATQPAAVDAAMLRGAWNASRDDGSKFSLDLGNDGTFTWTFTRDQKTEKIQGKYTVANDLLVLEGGSGNSMVGKVTPKEGGFNFRLVGGDANDPGLDFARP